MRYTYLTVLIFALLSTACMAEPPSVAGVQSQLNAAERRARAETIREAARGRGLSNGLILAGIANAETGLAHCWSEAMWACQGPHSTDCGGPVIAGSADGPCADEQGGLGMFQFDAGTYAQTLEREGEAILNVAGNVQAAVDFVVSMVRRSRYIEGVDTEEEALAWMNEVRPWNDLFHPWIQTVTHYYNGCVPGRCSVYDSRYSSYSDHCTEMLEELGSDFWYGVDDACGPIPVEGAILEESDACFVAGGPSRYWRSVMEGHGDGLLWTNATDNDTPANYAVWHLSFVQPGRYVIEAYTDARWAESRQTGYSVTHAGGTEVVRVDQTAVDGFQVVGTFDFGSGDGQQVRIDDNTGEPNGDAIAIVADALRITPENVTPMEPIEPMEPMEPMEPTGFMPDANVRRIPDGGCAVGGGERPSETTMPWWFLVGGLLLGGRARARS